MAYSTNPNLPKARSNRTKTAHSRWATPDDGRQEMWHPPQYSVPLAKEMGRSKQGLADG